MLYENNYLAHHGIRGQKWGVRRFQEEDGTLTAEGKERYGVGDKKYNGKKVANTNKDRRNEVKKLVTNKKDKADKEETDEEKKKAAEERAAKVKKILGITAGVAATAAITYLGVKAAKNYSNAITDVDNNIKEALKRKATTQLGIEQLHDMTSKRLEKEVSEDLKKISDLRKQIKLPENSDDSSQKLYRDIIANREKDVQATSKEAQRYRDKSLNAMLKQWYFNELLGGSTREKAIELYMKFKGKVPISAIEEELENMADAHFQ